MNVLTRALGAAAVAAAVIGGPALAQDANPQAMFDAYMTAFGRGDIEALVNAHAEDAVFITPDGVFIGRDQIRMLIAGIMTEFGMPGVVFEPMGTTTAGNALLFRWRGETGAAVYQFATETYVFDGGLIAVHTFAASAMPKR